MHAVDLERLVLAGFTAPSRPGASRDIAHVLACTDLDENAKVTLGRLGLWMHAFDHYAETAPLPALEMRVERYVQLDPARDPLAGVFRDVRESLQRAPLGDQLWPLWTIQLTASLHAMVWERRMAGRAPRLDVYLEHAADSICAALALTSAAMLIGEPLSMPALIDAERHASIALRLASDLAAPSDLNVLALTAPAQIRARIAAERAALDAAVATLGAPRTGAFVVRFTDAFLAVYDTPASIAA
jgi:hypothetical protein